MSMDLMTGLGSSSPAVVTIRVEAGDMELLLLPAVTLMLYLVAGLRPVMWKAGVEV